MKLKIILAFAAIYVIWGSTYIGILYAIESIPPWQMTAIRFIIASLCMGLIAIFRREGSLSKTEKQTAVVSGALLVFANGVVGVIEKWVPSGIAAVIIGAMPIWIMMIGWVGFGAGRPRTQPILGALVGLCGIALIASGDTHSDTTGVFGKFAPLVLCASSLLWATGTLIQRKASKVTNGISFLCLQMASGAAVASAMCFLVEDPIHFDWMTVTTNSWFALGYLIIFGSLIGFTAYSWLSRNVEPHLVSTYALVNPVIAVFLGWLMADEPLTGKFVSATLLVLVGLSILMFRRK